VHFTQLYSEYNSKTNDPKVFHLNLVYGMTLGYPRSDVALGLKGQRSGLGLPLTFKPPGFG